MRRSLFGRLNKWATRQSENFLTESFLFLLEELRESEPATFVRILASLTNNFLVIDPSDAREVFIDSQVRHQLGQPDISLRFRNRQAVIEVKDESPLGERQLERYREANGLREELETTLIVLTRYLLGREAVSDATANHAIRWLAVAEWLEEELNSKRVQSPAAQYVIRQFHHFLAEKGLAMEKIDPTLCDGIRPLKNLMELLREGLKHCDVKHGGVSFDLPYAVGIQLDGKRYHVGVRFDEPSLLQFRTYEVRVDPDRARALAVGEIYEHEFPNKERGTYRWRNVMNLAPENAAFFSLSTAEQLKQIQEFLQESLRVARQIEVPLP